MTTIFTTIQDLHSERQRLKGKTIDLYGEIVTLEHRIAVIDRQIEELEKTMYANYKAKNDG